MNFLKTQRFTRNSLSKYCIRFASNSTARDKDKRLSELFRLPKHDLAHEKIFENEPDEEELSKSILFQYKNNEELDKHQIVNKEFKKKRLQALNKTEEFFSNLKENETVKLSENIIERLRLKKEIKFDDEYKKRTILNEYGNYDKYFRNYTEKKETKYDSDDDGEMKWHMKFEELEEKYNNPNKLSQIAKKKQYQENAMKEALESPKSTMMTFLHHLANKREDNPIGDIDFESAYPENPTNYEAGDENMNKSNLLGEEEQNEKEEDKYGFLMTEEERRKLKEEEQSDQNDDPNDDDSVKGKVFVKRKEVEEIPYSSPFHPTKLKRNFRQVPIKNEENLPMKERTNTEKVNDNEDDMDTLQTMETVNLLKKNQQVWGRLSPWAKEDIYRSYLEGWSIKDLSYKYGILPQRVKVIVWCRDTFWRDVYPKVGETGLKLLLEREIMYAHEFKFVDYGKDLFVMSQVEAGVELHKLDRTQVDTDPPKDVVENMSKVLRNIKPKKMNLVPISFVGKGPHGYLIKEMIVNRGHGSKRVTQMFKKFCMYSEKSPHLLPGSLGKKINMPPRFATFGYRDKKK